MAGLWLVISWELRVEWLVVAVAVYRLSVALHGLNVMVSNASTDLDIITILMFSVCIDNRTYCNMCSSIITAQS